MNLSGEAKAIIGIGFATLVILIGAVYLMGKTGSTESDTPAQKVDSQKLVKEDSPQIKVPNAKVTIVEFLDYECEACGAAHPTVKKVLDDYEGKINYVVRHFPNHFNSVLAANTVEAAGEQGKYWEMQNKLFESQKEWGEKRTSQTELFMSYAKDLGLDMEKFKTALDTNKFTDKINKDKDEGISIGVNATPTFYINGVKEVGVLPYEFFKQKIDTELKK